jgi:hypothetical protein
MLKNCPYNLSISCNVSNCDNCEHKINYNIKQKAIEYFVDVIDGQSIEDIHAMTGIPINKCKDIYDAYLSLTNNY